jgi:hypothetical protein
MRRLLTPAWLARHGLAVALVAAFGWLGWWQIGRAAGGNVLSWAYAVEWPVFAGFVVFLWWREVRRELRPDAARPGGSDRAAAEQAGAGGFRRPVVTRRSIPGYADSQPYAGSATPVTRSPDEADLAAYNDLLAWLSANPDARAGDYPARAGDGPDRPAAGG